MKPGQALANLRKRHTIRCAVCGTNAVKRDPRALYCSAACKLRAQRSRNRPQ